jgi:hypothetical protein
MKHEILTVANRLRFRFMADPIDSAAAQRGARTAARFPHFWPLLALVFFHFVILAPSLIRQNDGLPNAIIPWDFIDSYHRYLVFISDSLRAKSLPLWFPYGNAGLPFFVNPQSQLWSPLTWIVSAFGGYTLLVAQRQEMLTFLLGGVGCYALANQLCRGRIAALFAAVSFSFSTARLGNAGHLDVVNALTICPWLLWGVLRVSLRARWAGPVLAFFVFSFIVCGYPGVVMLSPLWLAPWVLFLAWDQHETTGSRLRFIARLTVSGALGLLLAAGYWLPIVQYTDAFPRGAPMAVDAALGQSITFKDLAGIVFAWPATVPIEGRGADFSMRGVYFGIIALPLAVAAVALRRDRISAALGIGTVGMFIMALGSVTSIRQALNTYVSFMNLSRFPALDRGVAILGASLLAGLGLQSMLAEPSRVRPFIVRGYLGVAGVLALAPLVLKNSLFGGLDPVQFNDCVVAPIIAQLLWLAVALVVFARGTSGVALACVLCGLSFLDLGTNVQLTYGMVGVQHPHVPRAALAEGHVRTFSPAAALVPRIRYDDLYGRANNDAYTSKHFFVGGYGPFRLKRFDALVNAGFVDWITTGPRVVAFRDGAVPTDAASFVAQAQSVGFEILRYLPDRVDYKITLERDATIVFNEVYFPGWKARIDAGAKVALSESAGGFRSLALRAGSHDVQTWFSPTSFWIGAAMSLVGVILSLAWLAVALVQHRKRRDQS